MSHVCPITDSETVGSGAAGTQTEGLVLRPLVPADLHEIQRLVGRLSDNSAYMRFHQLMRQLPESTARMLCDEREGRIAWVWQRAFDDTIVAVGRCERIAEGRAELALLVEDAYQGNGLGRVLLSTLLKQARQNGLVALHASVLAVNMPVLKLLRTCGVPVTASSHGTTIEFVLHLSA